MTTEVIHQEQCNEKQTCSTTTLMCSSRYQIMYAFIQCLNNNNIKIECSMISEIGSTIHEDVGLSH
jgi:hypothetical protein